MRVADGGRSSVDGARLGGEVARIGRDDAEENSGRIRQDDPVVVTVHLDRRGGRQGVAGCSS